MYHFISTVNFWVLFCTATLTLVGLLAIAIAGLGLVRKAQIDTMTLINRALTSTNDQLVKRITDLENGIKKTNTLLAQVRLESEGRKRRLDSSLRQIRMMDDALNVALPAIITAGLPVAMQVTELLARIKIEHLADERTWEDWEITQNVTMNYIDEHTK